MAVRAAVEGQDGAEDASLAPDHSAAAGGSRRGRGTREGFPPTDDGTIFTTRLGTPYRQDYYGTIIFGAAVRRAGLPEGTTTHDLRDHYASVLPMQGESVIVVAERLGHENANRCYQRTGT